MSNQQSKKQSFLNANVDHLGKTGGYLQLCSFTFLCAQSLFRSSFRRWQLETSCLAQPPLLYRSGLKWAELQAQLGRTVVALCFCNWNSGTIARGKTRVALKRRKFTTAWQLASNLIDVPLAMKCYIANQKSRASSTQMWITLAKLVDTYNFAASLFCVHNLYFVAVLDDGSWKLAVLHSLLCCTDLVSNGQNCKHSLEEQ